MTKIYKQSLTIIQHYLATLTYRFANKRESKVLLVFFYFIQMTDAMIGHSWDTLVVPHSIPLVPQGSTSSLEPYQCSRGHTSAPESH